MECDQQQHANQPLTEGARTDRKTQPIEATPSTWLSSTSKLESIPLAQAIANLPPSLQLRSPTRQSTSQPRPPFSLLNPSVRNHRSLRLSYQSVS